MSKEHAAVNESVRRALLLLFVVAIPLASCKKAETPAKLVTPAAPAISESEATQFAKDYRDALTKPNVQRAAMMFDWDALLQKATASDTVSSEFREGFIRGASKAGAQGFAGQLAKTIQAGGDIHLLRVRNNKGQMHAVMRFLLPDGAVNYHEMLLERDASQRIRATDIYIYTSAEYLSDTMRRLYLFAAAKDPTLLQKLAGAKNPFAENIDQYKALFEKLREGDSKGAEEVYQKLPADLKKQKSVMLGHVTASRNLGDEAYGKSLEELRAAFPNDGAIDLMSIDAYLLKHQDAEAIKAIDRVDATVGGDPYLDVLRANILVRDHDLAKAKEHVQQAQEKEPDLAAASWTGVNISLIERNYVETARLLTHLRDDLHEKIADLRTLPEYGGFVRSPQYAQWAAK